MQELLEGLNPQQQTAATHIDGPLLILAGAGSGKTKTLTTRLAYLIKEVGIDPHNTLTLTFTNKAALEMRNRALSMIAPYDGNMPLLSTFHKFGLMFLKQHIQRLDRSNQFVIIDSDDKKRLIKELCKEQKYDLQTSFVSAEISRLKNALLSPEVVIQSAKYDDYKKFAHIYRLYQERLPIDNLVDFDDLLGLSYEILQQNDDLRRATSEHYSYVMVDEYQDTNDLQLKLLKLLVSEHNNLCVVGDDDQSIYGWRGANISNILEFEEHFKGAKRITLSTNYRSTAPILKAANNLIANNSKRLGKELSSFRGEGEAIELSRYSDETQEANALAKKIQSLLDSGVESSEIAVLYRVNALSRSLEEGFTKARLPFRLIGGMRFYERGEIKDLISYLRLISNNHDDFSLTRIINKPKRGIGKVTLQKIQEEANANSQSLYTTLKAISSGQSGLKLSAKIASVIGDFVKAIEFLTHEVTACGLKNFIELFDEHIGFKQYYKTMNDGVDRVQNIEEFYGFFKDSVSKNEELTLDVLLNDISLQSDQDQIEEKAITIMSVHASKGLEFEHLFVIGLEEGFFPLLGDSCNLEEERRLGYVAFTRAKSHLYLSYVISRFYKGKRKVMELSRFLGEAELAKKSSFSITKSAAFKKGDFVQHKIFGYGRVEAVTPSGKEYRLKINFAGNRKEILSSFVQAVR